MRFLRDRRVAIVTASVALLMLVAAAAYPLLSMFGGGGGGGGGSGEYTARSVQAYVADTPGIPLVLPRELPEHVVWQGPSFAGVDAEGTVVLRTTHFVHSVSGAFVELCMAGQQHEEDCSPAEAHLRRMYGTTTVLVSFLGRGEVDPAVEELWDTVDLTDDPGDVEWLR